MPFTNDDLILFLYTLEHNAWITMFLLAIFSVAQIFLHEGGHWIVGKLFGLPGGQFAFCAISGSNSHMYFPQVQFKAEDMLSLPRSARQLVFAGGILVDLISTSGIFTLLCTLDLPETLADSLLWAASTRVLTIFINLVPFAKYKNDGWRLCNPDSPD